MRRLLITALLLGLAATARAADEAKPNTLTQKEIEEGWILLFDGESTFGWRTPTDSKWTIVEGMLAPQAEKPGLLVTTSAFRDYELHFDFQIRGDSTAELLVGCDADGKAGPDKKAPSLKLPSYLGRGWWQAALTVRGGAIVTQRFSRGGGAVTLGLPPRVGDSESAPRAGRIAFSGNGFILRTIKLRPVNGDSLFTGKDLSGWKEFPGKKSQFSVTKEGWLNLKDGPGDIQSEGQWADFVVQLECVSNGDHCNSGVFFRCIPGEFENGYECQINNEFTDEPAKEYTIEVYDPKTNELTDKKKEKYTAVDYGTGGIYRRAPARKQLSKNHEWFALTVVADGRHVATWVNGVQAVDWTDDRPPNDNPRKGCRLEKGPISLQGHEVKDGPEDLSFRNIRVFDLSPKEEKKQDKKEP
jgi:hypothetical protein